jgi:hypothetical protein
MAYTQHTARLVARLRADLALIGDQQTRDLVAAWANAWDEIQPDLNTTLLEMLVAGDKVTRAQLMRSERLRKVLGLIADRLDTLATDARVRIVGDLRAVIDTAGGAQASILDSQLPAAGEHLVDIEAWTRVNPHAIDAIVTRSTQQITKRTRPLSKDAQRAVRRELVRGYAAGANPRATAARILARTEGEFNGGLTRALAIARTETLDASRAASLVGRSQHADVLAGWSWHCELSERSCIACISMDGTVFPNDAPGPDDHVNGRCTAIPVTKSWADLGFDIPEPAPTRVSGEDWFATLDAAAQKRILGPGRYAAWSEGRYPMSDWSTMRSNDGWRNSLQVTNLPVHSGGRAAGSSLAS